MGKAILFLGSLLMLFACGCGTDDDTLALGGNQESRFDLDGNWTGETGDGIPFFLRLNQTGAALGGDILVEGVRVGLAGNLNGNLVSFEAALSPTILFEASLNAEGTRMENGTMLDAFGTSANTFTAVKL